MRDNSRQYAEISEKRSTPRFDHASAVRIKDPQTGKLHNAMMVNYSEEGMYIESDSQFNSGIKIKIGIKNSPYASVPDTIEYFQGIILWCEAVDNSFFQFGYGIQLIR
jgi:hypothetical protein